jgi:hypothetical protein
MSAPSSTFTTSKAPAIAGKSRSRFYVGMAAFLSLVVIVGFWPTYYGRS